MEIQQLAPTTFSEAAVDAHRQTHARLAKTLLAALGDVDALQWMEAVWAALVALAATSRVAKVPSANALRFLESLVVNAGRMKQKVRGFSQQQFVSFLLTRLARGSNAKQAHVRFRVCQMLFILLNHVSEIDDDLHQTIKTVLMQRSRDKDQHVRVQASMALTRFQGPPDDLDESVVSLLIDLMTADSCADVRKSLVWNMDLNAHTLLPLLHRANDVDPSVRRFVYQKFASAAPDMMELEIEVRIALLGVGLKDRDAGVRKKCQKMLCDAWYKSQEWHILEFLKELDVRTVAAEEALVTLLGQHLVSLDFMEDAMWSDQLSPEFVFFAFIYTRTLNDQKNEDEIQEFLPSLTTMSRLLETYAAILMSPASNADEEESIKAVEFILTRLLQMTLFYDFSDEMGRRNVLECLKKLLLCEDFPTETICHMIRILQKMFRNEADVLAIVADAVCDIQDLIENGVESDDIDPDMRQLLLQMQSLEIIRALLEQIQKPPKQDPSFQCLLHRFIIPSVRDSTNSLLRQTGIHCLGLMCYIDKQLALETMGLFLHTYELAASDVEDAAGGGPAAKADTKKLVLQMVFDLVMIHGNDIVGDAAVVVPYLIKSAFEQQDDLDVLTIAVEGATKLMMMKFLVDAEVLQALLVLYFHPDTENAHRLRQCLTCFFPMFALSCAENQERLARVVVSAFSILALSYEDTERGLTPTEVAAQMIEWTDYRRLVCMQEENVEGGAQTSASSSHGIFAISLLEAMIKEPDLQKEGTKVLNALHIDLAIPEEQKKRILKLAEDVHSMLLVDPTSLKSLKRFTTKIEDSQEKKDGDESDESDL
ncbi:hypothetical protein HDU77_003040 [Chytriomyces hyalinus]|nr:hypothetical protein HDU77_003040 [Chytriomyces hyalinus]